MKLFKNHIRLRDRTLENDIKYKAPLSYRYVRIIAWACIIFAQIGLVAKANVKLIPSSAGALNWLVESGNFISALALPLFLLANFAFILQKKNDWKRLFIQYGGIALLLFLAGNFVIIHYGYGFLRAFADVDFMDMSKGFGLILFNMGNSGMIFNLFIDLFLCTLIYFLMNYTPKKLKGSNKIIWFRCLVILPILYEVASIIIKYFVATGAMPIPYFCFLLLTSKPPLMFVAFLILVAILKIEEIRAKKKKEDPEFIKEHRKTNAHALRFSIIIAIVFIAAALIDFIVCIIVSATTATNFLNIFENDQQALNYGIDVAAKMGFGNAVGLAVVAPIALLFSYTKTHEKRLGDIIVPVAGIVLILIVHLEGYFQILVHNIPILIEKISEYFQNLE